MGDLIDREELKKAAKRIESLPWGDEEGNRVEFQWSPKELESLIDKAPSAEPRWIPCSERLPEKYQYVLVTYNGLDGRRLVVVTNWNPNAWIESNSVAWTPVARTV